MGHRFSFTLSQSSALEDDLDSRLNVFDERWGGATRTLEDWSGLPY